MKNDNFSHVKFTEKLSPQYSHIKALPYTRSPSSEKNNSQILSWKVQTLKDRTIKIYDS